MKQTEIVEKRRYLSSTRRWHHRIAKITPKENAIMHKEKGRGSSSFQPAFSFNALAQKSFQRVAAVTVGARPWLCPSR